MALAGAIRSWAFAHPHDYSLVYGSPVPGYRAPAATVAPAERVSLVALRIVRDGVASGEIAVGAGDADAGGRPRRLQRGSTTSPSSTCRPTSSPAG